MRAVRLLLIASPLLLGACGVIAGLDAYSEQDGLTSDAGFDAGRPSADTGAGTSSVDSSVLPVDSGGPGVIIDDGGNTLDAGHDTGPPQMNCTLSQNGQGCGFDAASCCSGNCDETHTCSAYRGKDLTQGCSNDSPPSYSLITDRVRMSGSSCAVNLFCKPTGNNSTNGNCEPCIATGSMQPSFTWYVFLAGDKQILFDDGCCSRQVDNTGKCL